MWLTLNKSISLYSMSGRGYMPRIKFRYYHLTNFTMQIYTDWFQSPTINLRSKGQEFQWACKSILEDIKFTVKDLMITSGLQCLICSKYILHSPQRVTKMPTDHIRVIIFYARSIFYTQVGSIFRSDHESLFYTQPLQAGDFPADEKNIHQYRKKLWFIAQLEKNLILLEFWCLACCFWLTKRWNHFGKNKWKDGFTIQIYF